MTTPRKKVGDKFGSSGKLLSVGRDGHPQKRVSRPSAARFKRWFSQLFPSPRFLPCGVAGRVQCNCAEQAHHDGGPPRTGPKSSNAEGTQI